MSDDFVLDEAEFSIAVNKVSNLSLALSESIDDYVQILSNLQTDGIKDNLICSELAATRASFNETDNSVANYFNTFWERTDEK